MIEISDKFLLAKRASLEIGSLSRQEKNQVILHFADALDSHRRIILSENKKDLKNNQDLSEALIDRLKLNDSRIDAFVNSLREIAILKDYVDEIVSEKVLDNGLRILEKRVGFGVIGVIYESRPNVTVDVCALCFKSSSSAILKGGNEAINTNKAIIKIMSDVCPIVNSFILLEDRKEASDMLKRTDVIDLIIPRGGRKLIKYVKENSIVPVIETGEGNCHIFVDKYLMNQKGKGTEAGNDFESALQIIRNAKVQRPSVCNAIETALVHRSIAEVFLPRLKEKMKDVELRGCKITKSLIPCKAASEDDYATEFLDLILAVKVVDGINDAIQHINKYGTKHSECIISNDEGRIRLFQNLVDAAVVYSNASTRFTDGGEFGFGAEIGISTQKLHARGPMALKALTTTKYIVSGSGHVRIL
ncbi:glutamate-5-semialdehyde dehydrogenase [Candidatus Woesearchaeota archaeon]|nr:glutamate-5-semialdehyde dehydrogenase [Candidatus Woesearchaeota archaeon]